ncbi:MAG TPA: phosphatase PAP2 family protein [Candidatus Saccharimonadales bacterium]|nr:phosphatase PAP2 family protein [Candidatus Saccharimonadales bacterium]
MDSLVTAVAKYLIIVPVIVALYFIWALKGDQRKKYIILLIVGGLISLIIAKLAGHIYVNPRPAFKDGASPLFHADGYNGFPSDHTLLASLLGFVIVRFSRRWGWFVLVIAALIGWARVAGHVHHFVDILASFVITAVVVFIIDELLIARIHQHPKKDQPAGHTQADKSEK